MRRTVLLRMGIMLAALSVVAAACTGDGENGEQAAGQQEPARSLLETVRDRGTLNCGVNETVPGFGFLNPDTGEIEGFDIDFCKAVAAAVFETSEVDGTFELVSVSAEERFSALRAGNYDVLIRNTTWTSSRDGTEGIAFTHVNFYDSQGMFVREDSPYDEVADMDNTAVCVTTGTTTELNLADYMAQLGLSYEAVTFEENPQLQEAFLAERCDGWTSDRSQLAGIISQWPAEEGGPESLRLLPDIMSKEPLTPAVLDGDADWQDAVFWVVNGLVLAEELGVDSGNVDQMASDPPNAAVASLLGVGFEGGAPLDSGLGLAPDYMQHVLRAVGNYGEIYDRHVGSQGLGLERGLNVLAQDGGLQYAIPIR
jgi:general L-amino acid transport system substrate-binding protein